MRIFNLLIGDSNIENLLDTTNLDDKFDFGLNTDKYGNRFIENTFLRQKIRIDKNIQYSDNIDTITPMSKDCVYDSSNNGSIKYSYVTYDSFLPGEALKLVLNNKNMNPMFLKNRDPDGKTYDMLYLTIENNFQLLDYTTDFKIFQTFHKKNEFYGCAIYFDPTKTTESDNYVPIVSLTIKDKRTDAIIHINICNTNDEYDATNRSGLIITHNSSDSDVNEETYQRRGLGNRFKLRLNPYVLATIGCVVDKSNISEEEFNNILKKSKIKNQTVIYLESDKMNDEHYRETIVNLMKASFTENKIRAITLFGVTLDSEIFKTLKMIYAFKYFPDKKMIRCIRSN